MRALLSFLLLSSWRFVQALEDGLVVASWVKYPGSDTDLVITGKVYLVPVSVNGVIVHKLTWSLEGTDDACPTGSGNVCGIHVHEGVNCFDATTIGGHYSARTPDPWTAVRYNSTSDNTTSLPTVGVTTEANGIILDTGLSTQEMRGHAVVVHNSVGAGERIACGIADFVQSRPAHSVTKWQKYPGFTGTSTVSGTLTVTDIPALHETVELSWALTNADNACPIVGQSGNVCGIHIHAGKSCTEAAEVGGHHYNKTLFTSHDPWAGVRYEASNGMAVSSSFNIQLVTTGLDFTSLDGHAVVVHNSQAPGERIACGILGEHAQENEQKGLVVGAAYPLTASSLLISITALFLHV